MADRLRKSFPASPSNSHSLSYPDSSYALTAAGNYGGDIGVVGEGNKPWQEQSWAYFEMIGELNQAYTWFSNSMSRVTFYAAEAPPDDGEPVKLESGPAVEIMRQLSWDMSQIMKYATLDTLVVGRGYLVGREIPGTGERTWCVYSPEQIRVNRFSEQRRRSDPLAPVTYELWEGGREWIQIPDAMVVPLRSRDPRLTFLDTSPTKSNLAILRELDLLNRKIISRLVSRIASRGILLAPTEVSFPARKEFNDGRDPFYRELLENGSQAIKDPGSASAGLPLVLKVPAQFIEKFRYLLLESGVDEKTLDDRKAALERLADGLPLPREFVTGGMGDVNHWSGWLLEDSAIKTYISPYAEMLARDLATGFLYPQLIAARQQITGPSGGRIVVWYDTTELAAKPDRSQQAQDALDRKQIGPLAYLREMGFAEEDAPTPEELQMLLLLELIKQPANARAAFEELTGTPLQSSSEAESAQREAENAEREAQQPAVQPGQAPRGTPPTEGNDPPDPS